MQGQTYNLQSIAVGRIVQRPENEDKQKFQYYSGLTIKSIFTPTLSLCTDYGHR